MAGIYVHIPFCKSRCIYCGFFSTTLLEKRSAYVDAVVEELRQRRDFLQGESVGTIYFGGGTPSLLSVGEIERILSGIYNIYNVRENVEVTLEGNPDDLTSQYLGDLRMLGVNRLSIGVQTFDDDRLRFLGRRHTSAQAFKAVENAQKAGFENVSVDLMFGFPRQTFGEWVADVQQALALNVQHLSAYSLMYEDGTTLGRMLDRGVVDEIDDDLSLQMYEYLLDATSAAGFRHYEISNFALPGMESRHNSSYWHGIPYLGIGAGAHSYDGHNRYFHADSLQDFLEGKPWVAEHLTEDERYDEFVFTGLRTAEGVSLKELRRRFGQARLDYCRRNAQTHVEAGRLVMDGDFLRLSRQGLFVSNDIMSDLMWTE